MQYSHGGEKYDKNIELDFSANVNPFGMPESVVDALVDKKNVMSFVDYPDSKCVALSSEIAKKKGTKISNVICGNGASDIIYRICFALKPKKVLLTAPCFSEYEKAVVASGGKVCFYDTKEENDFKINSDLINLLDIEKPDMIFICSPSNPVGNLTERNILISVANWCRENRCHFIIDECFNSFVEEEKKYSMIEESLRNEYVHVLDAFTKIYGMAGLRLGYLISSNKKILELISRFGGCWNVSAPAQLAGIEALKCDSYVKMSKEYIKGEKEYLIHGLKEIGFKVYHGEANYILFKGFSQLYDYMLGKNILIRQCGNYRVLGDEFYRIAVRKRDENEKLLKVLAQAVSENLWQK